MPRNALSHLFRISLLALSPVLLSAATVSFQGNFNADNDEQFFNLVIGPNANTPLTIQTFSYGGGGINNLPPGGFAPDLSLYDSTGMLIALDDVGGTTPSGCYGRNIDPVTNACLDAVLYDSSSPPLELSQGTYTLVLTQRGNDPNGAFLSDGFSEDAANGNDPSYTGDQDGMPGKMFIDPSDHITQSKNNWEVEFTGDSILSVGGPPTATPEPGSALLSLTAFALLGSGFTLRNKLRKGAAR